MSTDVPTVVDHSQAGLVDFGDTTFTPEQGGSFDPVRRFILSKEWPSKPFSDRKFQIGGVERIALLTEQPYMFFAHRFSEKWLGSAANGYRRCTKEIPDRGGCVCCDHYETAGEKLNDKGKMEKDARCGKRQQRFGMSIIVYKTDLEGNLLDATNNVIQPDLSKGLILQNGQPAEMLYDTFLWVFGPDKFSILRTLKQQWGDLRSHDYICTLDSKKPDTFQDFSLTITPANAWKLAGKEKAKEMVEYYREHQYDVVKLLGKEYTDEELKQGLFGATEGQRRPLAQQQAVGDVAAEIQAELAGIQTATGSPGLTPPPPPPLQSVAMDTNPQLPQEAPAPQTPAITDDFDKLLEG